MRKWIGAVLLAAGAAFAAASGCGNPEIAVIPQTLGAGGGPDASASGGSSGTGFHPGEGGPMSMCPHTCAELNADCGSVNDPTCGVVVDCGGIACPKAGDFCGGAGPSKCGDGSTLDGGAGTDGGTGCVHSTCDQLNADCGATNDPMCPGEPIDCGSTTCPNPGDVCTSNRCTPSDGGSCVVDPTITCASAGYVCGAIADNCGNKIDCGGTAACGANQICTSGKCVTQGCTQDPAYTCAGQGFTCGVTADNCGTKLDCGPTDCGGKPGWSCGGGGVLGTCGCTAGLTCTKIPDCPTTGPVTTLKGKVYDPAGVNPLYNVLVYIPNDPSDPALKTFPQQISCDVCGATAAGSPLVSTFTGVDGSFTLSNVPAGTNIPIVIELGRWRRMFTISVPTACGANTVADKTLLMPSTQAQGNIPLMAMMTGSVDSLECVLRKMGIASTEFTDPAQNGRVQFYLGGGSSGQAIDANTPKQATLFSSVAGTPVLNSYDMAILACQGTAYAETAADQTTLRTYADKGGRVFMTHFSYTWATESSPGSAQNNAPANPVVGVTDNWAAGDGVTPSDVANWHIDGNDEPGSAVGFIDTMSNPKAAAFQGWLEAVGASAVGSGTVSVNVIRHDTDAISSLMGQTQQWLYRKGTNVRVCANNIAGSGNTKSCTGVADCGHVCSVRTQNGCLSDNDCAPMVCQNRTTQTCTQNSDCTGNRGPCVPNTCTGAVNACTGNDYTGKTIPLHFTFNTPVNLVQDLTKTPPAVQCGRVLFSDFHVQDASENGKIFPAQCGFGIARTRGTVACTRGDNNTALTGTNTCPNGVTCTCPTGATCNANADCANTCTMDSDCTGSCSGGKCPWGSTCTTNADCASKCSPDKRCLDPMTPQEKLLEFMIFDLGSCVPPPKTCTPKACPAGQCGFAPDGCGGVSPCNPCPTGTACGVGQPPVPNKCGSITCVPLTCPADTKCGYISDGCSDAVNCGMCPAGQVCVNGGCTTGTCVPNTTCASQNIMCGSVADNCGNKLDCGNCPAGQQCSKGTCYPDGCIPNTDCTKQNLACGQTTDNCGNKLDCGTCSAGEICQQGKCIPVN
ncbi:MAG TPA: hypothetical protein VGI10_02220 [Polyangiaceae bacterium]|jgi:hypothetical protein